MSEEVIEKSVEETQMEAIEEIKAKMDKMIDPEEYAKLKKSYDKLLSDYVNKRPIAQQPQQDTLRPAKEIANELRNIKDGDMNNRDYVKKSLEYRKSFMAEFGKDPWTDFGTAGSSEETPKTKYIAEALQNLVDENPSPASFRIALENVLRDDPQVVSIINKRNKQK